MSGKTNGSADIAILALAARMGLIKTRYVEGGLLRDWVDRELLCSLGAAGITLPDGFVEALEEHVRWVNERGEA